MKKNIIFLHTTGNWWDHRYYFKQIPALINAGYNVKYLIHTKENISDSNLSIINISEKKSKFARLTGGINLTNIIIKQECNIIQICNLELLPIGIILKIFFNKKVFYDCREDHFNAMLKSKVWFPIWIRYILGYSVKILEFIASKTFNGFIESDPAIYNFHKDLSSNKKMIFYNMALKSQFNEVDRNVPKLFDFTVLGSMSVRTGVLDVVKAVGRLKQDGRVVKLKLIGNPQFDTKLWEQIQECINEYNLQEDIYITGRIPYFEIPYALADCKVGIIPLLDIPKFQNNIATKQFEYMASEMPVIASDLPPQKIFIKDRYNGFHYEPGNIEELVQRMDYFLKDPLEAKRMGDNAKFKTETIWNSEKQQEKLVSFYKMRMENKPYQELQIPPFFND